MTRPQMEKWIAEHIRQLPEDAVQDVLDFVRTLGNGPQCAKRRPLGLLKGKGKCRLGEDFIMTDEEMLRS